MTRVLIWLTEGTWQACVEAARGIDSAEVTLLYVMDESITEAMHGAYGGLLSRHGYDPGQSISALMTPASQTLLEEAQNLLSMPCSTSIRQGRIEREVVAACAETEVLICARDGERDHPGPKVLATTLDSWLTMLPAQAYSSGHN